VIATRSTMPLEAAALLDAMPDSTAVVAHDGTIVAVNRAWRMFAIDNGGTPESTGLGVSYADVCERSAAAGCSDAAAVQTGLLAVLDGATVECELEYLCSSPSVNRWFELRITQIAGTQTGALVSHVNISRRKVAERNLERRASEDSLTGLANRAFFLQRVNAALTLRPSRPPQPDVGLLVIDLVGFKMVNDTYGHASGDEVLQTVASRLKTLSRPQDTIARLGGDEFAVLAPRITVDGLAVLVGRITEAFTQTHLIHGTRVEIGASVGAYLAACGESAPDAINRADEAMYRAKRRLTATRVTPALESAERK